MVFQVTIIFSGATFPSDQSHSQLVPSQCTADFKHSLLSAKARDSCLSLQLQTQLVRDGVCTYGKATFRRLQKSLNYNQMVFLFYYFIFLESMYQEDRAIFFLPPGTKKVEFQLCNL